MVWGFPENHDLELGMSLVGTWEQACPIELLLEILVPNWDKRFLIIVYLKLRLNWASCVLAGNPMMGTVGEGGSQTGPCTRGQGQIGERQTTPGQQVASFIKRTYLRGLSYVAAR